VSSYRVVVCGEDVGLAEGHGERVVVPHHRHQL
jgi:hypothetical protein